MNIEIISVKCKAIYNEARGVADNSFEPIFGKVLEVEWTTPEIAPMVKCNLYSLDPYLYKELCEKDLLYDWFKMVINENETRIKKK